MQSDRGLAFREELGETSQERIVSVLFPTQLVVIHCVVLSSVRLISCSSNVKIQNARRWEETISKFLELRHKAK